jgi:hypothetical protein
MAKGQPLRRFDAPNPSTRNPLGSTTNDAFGVDRVTDRTGGGKVVDVPRGPVGPTSHLPGPAPREPRPTGPLASPMGPGRPGSSSGRPLPDQRATRFADEDPFVRQEGIRTVNGDAPTSKPDGKRSTGAVMP